jgi:cytochrome c553
MKQSASLSVDGSPEAPRVNEPEKKQGAPSIGSAANPNSRLGRKRSPHSQGRVMQLFATTCGWCHSDAGRAPGKGPQLMNTERSDDFIRNRIRNGREGAMPAFGNMFSDADIDEIINYIRSLKPDEG